MGNSNKPRCEQCRAKECKADLGGRWFCSQTCRRAWERDQVVPQATRPSIMQYHTKERDLRYHSAHGSEEMSDEGVYCK